MIIGIAMRKWYGERVLKKLPAKATKLNAEEFLKALNEGAEMEMEVKTAKRTRLTDEEIDSFA